MRTNYNVFFIKKKLTLKMENSNVVVTSNNKEKEFCIKEIRNMNLSFNMSPVRKCNRNRLAILLGEVKSIE